MVHHDEWSRLDQSLVVGLGKYASVEKFQLGFPNPTYLMVRINPDRWWRCDQ